MSNKNDVMGIPLECPECGAHMGNPNLGIAYDGLIKFEARLEESSGCIRIISDVPDLQEVFLVNAFCDVCGQVFDISKIEEDLVEWG